MPALHRQETFRTAMRQNAIEYDVAEEESKSTAPGLNFSEFCALVHSREEGDHPEEELRARFRALDITGSGMIEKHEYLRFSLRDALARSHTRVVQIFEQWDDDGDGNIDETEFRKAVRALGFSDVSDKDIANVFLDFDEDRSGEISRLEVTPAGGAEGTEGSQL